MSETGKSCGIIVHVSRVDSTSKGFKGDVINEKKDPLLCLDNTVALSTPEAEKIRNTIRTCLSHLETIMGKPINLLEVWHDQAGRYPEDPEIGINIVSK